MSLPLRFHSTVLSLFIAASTVSADTVGDRLRDDPKFQLFAVFFAVTVDSHSKIQTFKIASVTDPRTDSSDCVDVRIPPAFVAAVRSRAQRKRHPPKFRDGKPVEFFIFYFYSPAHPRVLISDLKKSFDDQP
jgi:hypothetical protein